MIIEDILSDLMNHVIHELKKPTNRTRIQVEILDPIITYTFKQMYPYIIATSLLFFFTFLIAVVILVLLLKTN